MPQLASWIRECDQRYFRQFLDVHADVLLRDARIEPVDLDSADGLLITGGPDISAEFLNQDSVDASLIRDPDPVRDAWEMAAIRSACERGLPLLCICKGLQALNVALGGTLLLDIPGHDRPGADLENVHPLRHAAGAAHRFEKVNSSHHQALDRVADALEVEAWHPGDGIIEQVRIRNHPWGLGVQYHPERDLACTSLFEDFFAQLGR
jgi:putative glutamine amidotransferase